ncbi:MAG TPA: ABC transporter substrate-binding protein [Candidatus Limnocylindrales bacterium]|nr:ABC transporter substrate-binding protein [Candidatus Limnocylindrales bacterium]
MTPEFAILIRLVSSFRLDPSYLISIGWIVLTFAANVSAQDKLRISPSSPGLASWPVHLAAKEGFFTREGLTSEIIVMRTNTGIAALVTGSIDFTTAGGSAMRAAVNGAPLKMILNITKKADLWIVAQKNILRVEDLRGKMVGVGGNWGTQFYQVLEALKPSGVDKDVQLVSTGDVANGFPTLQQGSMPAVALTPPYSILAKRMGYRDLVKTSDVIPVSPTTGLVTTKEKLDKEAPKIRRTIRALFRAVDFARTRKNETVQFIMNQYKMDKDVSEAVYDAIMETLNPTLSLSDQEVQVELNRIAEQTKTKITMKPSELADFSLTRQVAQEFGR